MRLPSVSRIRTWVLARMDRVWSQLAPRKQVGELGAVAVDMVRSRRELVLENAVLRHQVNESRPHQGAWPTHTGGTRKGHRPVQADHGHERARWTSRRLPQGSV